jgi:hypothetical protein
VLVRPKVPPPPGVAGTAISAIALGSGRVIHPAFCYDHHFNPSPTNIPPPSDHPRRFGRAAGSGGQPTD